MGTTTPRASRFVGTLGTTWGATATPDGLMSALRPAGAALPVPPATDRAAWDAVDRPTLDSLVARAGADLGRPWPVTSASTFARLHRDGDRDAHEQRVFARQHRLTRAAVLAAARPLDDLLDEVADGVLLLCEQTSWCWPAHDRFAAGDERVLPDVTRPFLDLGAGEVAGQLAWVDHLLGDALDARWPGLRERIRHEVDTRVLRPFEDRDDWHWIGLDGDVHNWNPWIHGNVLVAALALVDDPARRSALVARAVEGLDRYVTVLPADGAIDEGYAYWWNGACRALEALELLRHATGGALDATEIGPLAQTVAFPHRMHLGGDWYLNVADGEARPSAARPWHALHRAARSYGDADALAHAGAHRVPGTPVADEHGGLGRLLQALSDPAWVGAAPGASPLRRDVWLPSVQVLLARGATGSAAGLTLAMKGGHDDEHHNHNDVGSFVVALQGVPVAVDAGRPTYTRQTFSPDRYAIWTMQSAWHNVPEVAGVAQPPSRDAAARDVRARIADAATSLELDLADAYPGSAARSWRRTARLDRRTGAVTVRDLWTLGAPGRAPSRVRVLLAGDVVRDADGLLVRALDDAGTVRLRWSGDVASASTEVRALDDPMLTQVWGGTLTRLTLVLLDAPTGSVQVTLEEVA
ncbi:heparinase II/III domain-containing protein [Cellulomonas hominis]